MRRIAAALAGFALVAAATASGVVAAPAFSNTPLIATWSPPAGVTTSPNANSTGNSEPAIAFGRDGTMVVDGLAWLPYQVNLWKGSFGTTPAYFGAMDTSIPTRGAGRIGLGDGDADVEVTSAGTILLTDLDFFVNRPFNNASLGVSVTRCPAGATSKAACSTRLLDQAGADRPWITVNGTTAYISYHDSGSSSLIHVLRSSDDGLTWQKATSPIPGQGGVTGNATFNNIQGPIVADPHSGNVYDVYAAGEAGIQKGTSAAYNNVYVARSTDGARTWTSHRVFHAPLFHSLSNIFPALAADPTNGTLYAAWSDLTGVWVSISTDAAQTWSAATKVSSAATVVMPWVAARNGVAHVVYYGSAQGVDDPAAVWNVYDSKLAGGSWGIEQVSNTPNRVGAVCLEGAACASSRQLLDLFEVAIDPGTNRAAIIYTDTTIDTYSVNGGLAQQLPEIVLAFEQ